MAIVLAPSKCLIRCEKFDLATEFLELAIPRNHLSQQAMSNGYIYLVWAEGTNRFKIGKTLTNPYKRLRDMRTGSPYSLELCGVIETDRLNAKEIEIHQQFSDYRVKGEWFQLPPSKIKEVLQLFNHENLRSLKGYKSLKPELPYRPECWSSLYHPRHWEWCWDQESMYLVTERAMRTGWMEDHRSYWQMPEGIAGYGVYKFRCILIWEGEKRGHVRDIAGYVFELPGLSSNLFSPIEFLSARGNNRFRRIVENISAGKSYIESLKYLGSTYLSKITDHE